MDAHRIGLQLYSVRDRTEVDLPDVLAKVSQMGYEGVEFAGLAGHRPATIRGVLDGLGLAAVGAHVSLEDLEAHRDRTIGDLLELGCGTAIVAWLPPTLYVDEATAGRTLDRLLAAGESVRAAGLGFAYHNHAFEFEPVGNLTVWSLLTGAPARELPLEIDVYWLRQAGLDPAEAIRALGSRVVLIHAKDSRAPDVGGDCPVGEGIERWPDVFRACRQVGVEWLIVEQEHSQDSLADAHTSIRNLRRLLA